LLFVGRRVGRRVFSLWKSWLLTALLLPRVAAAGEQGARYAVKWSTGEGAESCAQQAEMTAAVGRLVSTHLLADPEYADRFIVGTVSRLGSWRAQFSVRDAAGNILGERELESNAASCGELDSAAALAIALIVDPERRLSPAQLAATSAPPSRSATPVPVQVVNAPPARVAEDAARVSTHRRTLFRRREQLTSEPSEGSSSIVWHSAEVAVHRERLERVLSTLPEEQANVFVLYELEELTMSEIATALGYPLQTAYSRLYAARKAVLIAFGERKRDSKP
jgi:Sigma-70, region 4